MQNTNSTVVVLGTGGTIAGTAPPGAADSSYRAAQLGVGQLLQAVSGLSGPVEGEQVAQIDSKDMSFEVWGRLAARVAHHLARPEVAGVVITHGTDTLEETAYFLHRMLGSTTRPVVLTAAMRPATSAEADGPRNLGDALSLVRHEGACGVLAVVAGRVFGALDVRKAHPTRLDAFGGGEAGPVAQVDQGRVTLLRPWPVQAAAKTVVLPADPAAWPRVEIVLSHAGADGTVVRALCAAGVRGLVVASTGNGSLHQDLEAALLFAGAAGVAVWRSTQCAEGALQPRPGDVFPAAAGLTPVKARIGLMLDLMASD